MSTLTDEQLLVGFTENLMNAFTDTEGTDDERWRAVANEALERLSRGDGFELAKRRRKWGQPIPPPPPGTLPPAVPIASPDQLGIALAPEQ
jgi:hypothetical protein